MIFDLQIAQTWLLAKGFLRKIIVKSQAHERLRELETIESRYAKPIFSNPSNKINPLVGCSYLR